MEKQLTSETIYDGKIIHVVKDKVEAYNGNPATREVVYHHGGVCILAIEEGCILLVKQYRYPFREDTIEIPAGKLEKDENPSEAAYREFEEETNRRAENMKFLFDCYPTPGYCSEVLHIYQAIKFKEVHDSLEADLDEDLHLIKMPIDQAYQAIFKGQIKDAKTIIAIMYIYANKEKLL